MKPQGSLERSREEREQIQSGESIDLQANGAVSKTDPSKMKRIKQNVALQSIFKKMEENKQVKISFIYVAWDQLSLCYEYHNLGRPR